MDPQFLARHDGPRLAYRHRAGTGTGTGPTLIFLPGYKSDMLGGKAEALDQWAANQGRAMLRLDYSGCGESDGAFEDGTLEQWRDDALAIIAEVAPGPILLIGSSMGGWLMLLIALSLGDHVKGLIGIAPAPDFTQWGFSESEKQALENAGRIERFSEYGPDPMVTTRAFWQSGQRQLLLDAPIQIDCPVRLIHGQRDDSVPWEIALRLAGQLRSADVQVHFIKDGDHRLSREQDIDFLIVTTAHLLEHL